MLREIIDAIWMNIIYTIAVLTIAVVYMTNCKNADRLNDLISSVADRLVDDF
jgi:hypothetical protein